MCIRFKEEEVRPMGLIAAGVNGMKLAVGDEVVSADQIVHAKEIALICSDGRGKRTATAEFPVQGRYGQGVIGWRLKPGIRLAGIWVISGKEAITLHFLKAASKLKRVDEIPTGGRAVLGREMVDVKPGDQIIGLTGVLHYQSASTGENGGAEPPKRKRGSGDDNGTKSTASRKTPAKAKATTRSVGSRAKSTTRAARTTGSKTTGRSSSRTSTTAAARKTTATTKPAKKPAKKKPGQLKLEI